MSSFVYNKLFNICFEEEEQTLNVLFWNLKFGAALGVREGRLVASRVVERCVQVAGQRRVAVMRRVSSVSVVVVMMMGESCSGRR